MVYKVRMFWKADFVIMNISRDMQRMEYTLWMRENLQLEWKIMSAGEKIVYQKDIRRLSDAEYVFARRTVW